MDDSARLPETHVLERDSDAFGAWVRQHLDLVYSAARRQVAGNTHRAEEVTQLVFLTAHRKASALARHPAPLAWLHQATRHAASELRRAETRRLARETTAATDPALAPGSAEPPADWTRVAPLLDDALATLRAPDREAILLRYFAGQSYAETGRQLGLAENAARMRTDRALEKLRLALAKRGVTSTASALGLALTGHAVSAAPATVSASTFAALGAGIAGVAASTLLLTMTFLQKSLLAALVLSSLGVAVYQTRHVSRLERALAAQQATQDAERTVTTARLDALQAELAALRQAAATRARDAAQTRTEEAAIAQEPTVSATVAWMERLELLKTLIKARPEAAIPELEFLQEEDWLAAAQSPLHTEGDVRRALAELRSLAESRFGSKSKDAMKKFTQTHGAEIPDDPLELLPYFDPPVPPAIFARWRILRAGDKSRGGPTIDSSATWGITTGPRSDDEMDGKMTINADGSFVTSGFKNFPETLFPVMRRFAETNASATSDRTSFTEAELLPYAQTPEERAALQAHFGPIQLPPPQS